jgi:PAS domain S-box-containing protein
VFKELLLQFIVSLLPVFAFQFWHHKDRDRYGMSVFMGIFFGASLVLCMLTGQTVSGYAVNFGLIPYLLGSLYGGLPALAVLTVIYAAMQIPMLDSGWETVSFILFIIGFIPLMLLAIRPFQRASAQRKKRNSLLFMSVLLLYFTISVSGFLSEREEPWSLLTVLGLVLYISASLTATWLSVIMIESVKEKQLFHDEVRRVSANYRNETEKLQQFIDETAFAVIIVDSDGRITHYNEMAKNILFLRAEYNVERELLGASFSAVFQPNKGDAYVKMLHQALKGMGSSLVPLVDGEKVLLNTAFSLRNPLNEQITGASIIVQDITELSQLRDEIGRMERLSLVGQMAASITHEIRNPMAVIRGFVQLIQERSPKSQFEYFRIVMEELDRANMIISDFLSLAQNRELTMELSSLHDIIEELIPLLNADANLRGQTIKVSFCDDLPLIMLNNREIKQLLLNIARNGMEAMGDKGVLRISTRCTDDKIELRVTDEGVGIPPEKMKHLFKPFFTTKTQGTGLGLPLCMSIAERHNGRIDVESREGEGTTFIVTFCCSKSKAAVSNA